MARYAIDTELFDNGMAAIAEALRAQTGSTEPLSFPDGMAAEAAKVYEAGQTAEYDGFWDAFQQNGERTDYSWAFHNGGGWMARTKPKYDLKPVDANNMFSNFLMQDLESYLDNAGIVLDTSNCVSVYRMFNRCDTYAIPTLDLRAATSLGELFAYGWAQIIRKIILSDTAVQDIGTMFHGGMVNLREVCFEGVIGSNINIRWSHSLEKASLVNIISALSDAASGLTASFSLTAVNTAFETEAGAANGSASEEWLALAATKSNWTISLA